MVDCVREKAVLTVIKELFAHFSVSSSECKWIAATKHLDMALRGSDQEQD